MDSVSTTGPIAVSEIMRVFGLTGETKLSTLVRGGAVVPDIADNAAVPVSTAVMSFSSFRGTRKTIPWVFILTNVSGTSICKYDSATSSLRLNTGTEMMFSIVKGSSVFDGNGYPNCYALRETTTGAYLRADTSGAVSMQQTLVTNDPAFSFRVFTNDGGLTYRIYSSSPMTKTGTLQTDAAFPYKNAWLAYNQNTDTIYAAAWSTVQTASTAWRFVSVQEPDETSVTNAMSQIVQEFPVAGLTGYTTNLSGYAYGNGVYTVTVSRDLATRQGWKAFDYAVAGGDSAWQCTDIAGSSTVNDYLQIQLPFGIRLQSFGIHAFTNTIYNRTPSTFSIYGIRPGDTTLELLGNYTKVFNYNVYVVGSPGNSVLYDRIRLTVTSNTSLASVTDLRLFGTW